MKKIAKIFSAALLIMTVFVAAALCVNAAEDMFMFKAEDLIDNVAKDPRTTVTVVDDYLHVTTGTHQEQYVVLNFAAKDVTDADFKPAFNVADYPFVVIRYRSNIEETKNTLSINAGIKLKKTNVYERCWGLSTEFEADGQWKKAIFNLTTFGGCANDGSARFGDVSADSGVKYIRIPAWINSTGGKKVRNEYLDIKYVAFFKNKKDAEEYGGADVEMQGGSDEVIIDTKGIDAKVYSASQIASRLQLSKNFLASYIGNEPVKYLRVTAEKGGTGEYIRFDPLLSIASDADYVPEFKVKDYPITVISYRSNMKKTTNLLKINAGLLIKNTGKYERCWALNAPYKGDGQWQKAIYDIRTFKTYDGGDAVFSDVDTNSGIRYIRIPAWADSVDESNLKNEFFDIEYIGFFKTTADAEKFKSGIDSLPKFKLTLKADSGNVISVTEYIAGSYAFLAPAPEANEKEFVRWTDMSGKEVSGSILVDKDITLIAVYKTDEAAVAENKRLAEMDAAIKAGKIRTDTPFIKGYDGFLFKPDNNMTRAEACTVITRLLVDENTVKGKYTSSFTDLEKNAWYYSNIAYLESLGYLKSYSGKFEPNKNITRAEFVELVYAMGKVTPNPANKPTFSDVPATHPRYEVIMAGASAGLVSGRPGGIFDPDGTIKRSEVVKVLCAALGRTPDKNSFLDVDVIGFGDIDANHWAYPYVIESAYEHKCIEYSTKTEGWTEINDTNDYLVEVPSGLVDKLEAEFESRKNAILNTKSEWTVAQGGTVWYISSSQGNDSNDGKSAQAPIQSYKKFEQLMSNGVIKNGDVVLFKRGDEWHGKLNITKGITISAYGEGAKPRLLGSVEADNVSDWIETDVKGVYKYKTNILASADVGNIVFNDGEGYGMRVLPQPDLKTTMPAGDQNIVSNGYDQWLFPPRAFEGYKTLADIAKDTPKANYMFYHDWKADTLYLYSKNGNPGDIFDSIEICTTVNAVTVKANNVTFDNVCVKFTGAHGIGGHGLKNLTVRNSEVGWIGGSVQAPGTGNNGRYGNAVEIFGAADGFYVYNNYMYQCFDCGPTVQWQGTMSEGQKVVEKDVLFYDNVLREASLEVWLSTSQENTDTTYAKLINCRMYNNMITGSGTGFKAYNHQKNEWCAFYGGVETKAEYIDCYMESNYYWGNRRHLIKAIPTSTKNGKGFIWKNNTIIHPYGEGSLALSAKDLDKVTGFQQYFYDDATVEMLLKEGAMGVNKFYYTPGNPANQRKGMF